jgi:hypothetical protein
VNPKTGIKCTRSKHLSRTDVKEPGHDVDTHSHMQSAQRQVTFAHEEAQTKVCMDKEEVKFRNLRNFINECSQQKTRKKDVTNTNTTLRTKPEYNRKHPCDQPHT